MTDRPDEQLELRFSRSPGSNGEGRVVSLDLERRRRAEAERQKLEQLVIERWTGRDELEA
jgi:hypothetical protein